MFINIDSKDRSIGTEFNFTKLIEPPIQNVKKIKIKSIELPVAFHNIRSPLNVFTFNIYDSGNTLQNTYTLTIKPSNYSATTFTSYLQTLFNSSVLGTTGTITYDSIASTLNITLTNNYQIEIVSTPLSNILGFTDLQKANSLTSANSYNFNHDLYVNLVIGNTISNYRNSNTSIKIPINVNQTKILYLYGNELFNQTLEINDNVLYRLSISVFDRYGNLLSNNGVDWSFTLELE